jgi:hypothetical protein
VEGSPYCSLVIGYWGRSATSGAGTAYTFPVTSRTDLGCRNAAVVFPAMVLASPFQPWFPPTRRGRRGELLVAVQALQGEVVELGLVLGLGPVWSARVSGARLTAWSG